VKRLSCGFQFVNDTGDDLIPGKIHSLRQNYDYWKKFEGKDLALYIWEGKPYRSKQKVFCVKRLEFVQRIKIYHHETANGDKMPPQFFIETGLHIYSRLSRELLAANDGFESEEEFTGWFYDYPDGKIGILHFTNFRYGKIPPC
jgi:hypothetical protein